MENKIDPIACCDYIRDHALEYAQAKANVTYMTEYRKTIKSELMQRSESKTDASKEAYAYAHAEYKKHLEDLAYAIQKFETYRWMMVAAEAKIEIWRSLEASARAESRATQ